MEILVWVKLSLSIRLRLHFNPQHSWNNTDNTISIGIVRDIWEAWITQVAAHVPPFIRLDNDKTSIMPVDSIFFVDKFTLRTNHFRLVVCEDQRQIDQSTECESSYYSDFCKHSLQAVQDAVACQWSTAKSCSRKSWSTVGSKVIDKFRRIIKLTGFLDMRRAPLVTIASSANSWIAKCKSRIVSFWRHLHH